VRLWPLALIGMGIGCALGWIWGFVGEQRQDRILATYLVVGGAFALVLLWLLVLSRLTWRVRLGGLAVLAGLPLAAGLLLERRGVTGDIVPVFGWRWSKRPALSSPVARPTPSGPARATGAADYPQFLGAHRDGTVPDARLSRDWTRRAPREIWRRPVGAGWSGFAVAGSHAVTQEQRGDDEVVACYDRATGEPVWTFAARARHEDPLGGLGPRATPTIADGRVHALGATGLLHALDLVTGAPLWTVDVLADSGAPPPQYGLSGSPLVTGGLVIVLAGGGAGKSLAAYDAGTGARAWSGGDDRAAYSSPVAATIGGIEQIVVLTQSHLAGHAAATGARLWAFPWPDGTEKVSQPVVLAPDRVFVSTGYGVGGKLVDIVARGAAQEAVLAWESGGLKAKFTNVVHRDGYLYGLDDGRLACIDVVTGARRWKGGRYGHGQTILAGDLLLIQAETGEVGLVEAAPEAYRELGRVRALRGKTWNHPALAGAHLVVRNDVEAACYELPLLDAGAVPGDSTEGS